MINLAPSYHTVSYFCFPTDGDLVHRVFFRESLQLFCGVLYQLKVTFMNRRKYLNITDEVALMHF